jgi:LacI family transcriptional regulator
MYSAARSVERSLSSRIVAQHQEMPSRALARSVAHRQSGWSKVPLRLSLESVLDGTKTINPSSFCPVKKPPVTLEDLARQAGVHRSTVSLALRGSTRISAPRRAAIQALAKEMGYRPNPLVSALMSNRRRKQSTGRTPIAFITNFPSRFGWRPIRHPRPDFYPSAVERAHELGYELDHYWLAEPGITPNRFCNILLNRGVHGLIVGRLPPGQNSLDLDWDAFSCLALGLTLREPALHHVTENHFDTARQAVRRCRAYGYHRIGFVASEEDDSPRVGLRWRGALLSTALEFPPAERLAPCPQVPPDFDQFQQWMTEQRPDALLVSNAEPVLAWLDRMGLQVPHDLGLVELGSNPNTLACAGVDYEPGKIGTLAIDMLVGMMHRNETGIPEDPHTVLMHGRWRDGWSLPDRRVDTA